MAQLYFTDYYNALNIKPNASDGQIRAAYILRAKDHHPDIGGNVKTMRILNQAYATLRNPVLRRQYDLRYRQVILGEPLNENILINDDLDLDEVDELLRQAYQKENVNRLRAMALGASLVFLALLLFVTLAVLRMTRTVENARLSSHIPQGNIK